MAIDEKKGKGIDLSILKTLCRFTILGCSVTILDWLNAKRTQKITIRVDQNSYSKRIDTAMVVGRKKKHGKPKVRKQAHTHAQKNKIHTTYQ